MLRSLHSRLLLRQAVKSMKGGKAGDVKLQDDCGMQSKRRCGQDHDYGYIDAGVIPKYAGCVNGVQWFKDRGQWLDNSAEPAPGMIIFFDWADESGQDGLSDHTGIVQKVENGRVYTVEGNSGDSVRQNSYPVGYYEILGYGAPAY